MPTLSAIFGDTDPGPTVAEYAAAPDRYPEATAGLQRFGEWATGTAGAVAARAAARAEQFVANYRKAQRAARRRVAAACRKATRPASLLCLEAALQTAAFSEVGPTGTPDEDDIRRLVDFVAATQPAHGPPPAGPLTREPPRSEVPWGAAA